MSGIVGSRLNNRGSGLVGSLGTDGQALTSSGAGTGMIFEALAAGGKLVKSGVSFKAAGSYSTINSTTFTAIVQGTYTPDSADNTLFVYSQVAGQTCHGNGNNNAQAMNYIIDVDDNVTGQGIIASYEFGKGNGSNTAATYYHKFTPVMSGWWSPSDTSEITFTVMGRFGGADNLGYAYANFIAEDALGYTHPAQLTTSSTFILVQEVDTS